MMSGSPARKNSPRSREGSAHPVTGLTIRFYFDNCRNMEQSDALDALAALAQGTRLDVFRLLVAAGPAGLAAGEIANRLAVAPATLSFHLQQMKQAGLIGVRRVGRSLIYAADFERMGALLDYLMRDCCGGRPEICGLGAPVPPAPGRRTDYPNRPDRQS